MQKTQNKHSTQLLCLVTSKYHPKFPLFVVFLVRVYIFESLHSFLFNRFIWNCLVVQWPLVLIKVVGSALRNPASKVVKVLE